MKRRAFLKIAASALAGLGVVGAALRVAWRGFEEWRVIAAVEAEFAHLGLAPEAARRFAADHRKYDALAASYDAGDRPDLLATFLLSTDYFQRSPESRDPIAYRAYYDPYVSPCRSPMPVRRPQA